MSSTNRKFIFLAAITGNILEYYDFTVYSVFAVAIGEIFFSAASPTIQTLASLGVFAVGFLTRPIGGVLFGYIGDHYGRRVSLITSVLGMTITTFAIGMIPGHSAIGIMAPILLIILRLIQGLCISGEGAGAAIFLLEHYGNLRPGLVTGIVQASNIIGTFIASLVGIAINRYFAHIEEAWRFAFILGGMLGIAGFYLRLKAQETPIFKILAKQKKVLRAPFIEVLKKSWRYMLITIIVAGVASSIVYLIKAYVTVLYISIMKLDEQLALSYLAYSTTILMFFMPIAGFASDLIGRLKILQIAALIQMIVIIPILYLMCSENSIYQIIGLTLIGIIAGLMSGGAYIFVIGLFDPQERFTGVAVSYNIGVALFGGTAPMIATMLVNYTNLMISPGYYIIFLCAIFLLITKLMQQSIDLRFKNEKL